MTNTLRQALRNATEITTPTDLTYRPSSALRQQLHSWAMRRLSRLEYERSSGASWVTYSVRIPNTSREMGLQMACKDYGTIGHES
jgi:hypothetical protein